MKCYLVKLKSLIRISDKAYKATAFDGTEDILPVKMVIARESSITTSEAWWVSAWILERKKIPYSKKDHKYFDIETLKEKPEVIIEKHKPKPLTPVASNEISSLLSDRC